MTGAVPETQISVFQSAMGFLKSKLREILLIFCNFYDGAHLVIFISAEGTIKLELGIYGVKKSFKIFSYLC